jgi:hypothetical protein
VNKNQHTPTPWATDGRFVFAEDTPPPLPAISEVFDFSKELILPSGEANAHHIVHCVNLHDELVAALEAAHQLWFIDEWHSSEWFLCRKKIEDTLEQVASALSKAKQEEVQP